jgi:hypothetical protein
MLALMGLVLAAAAIAPRGAAAQNIQVIQKGCDTLSIDPPFVRVRFAVLNMGTVPVCSIHMTPIQSGQTPPDSCRIFECSVPTPGWECSLVPGGGAMWRVLAGYPCIYQYQKHEEFDIVLDPFFCCYEVAFDDPSGQIFWTQTVCFECDKPVASRSGTWGGLKLRYR